MFLFLFSQLTWINALGLIVAGMLGYVFWLKQTTKGFPPCPTIPLPILGNAYHPGLITDPVGQLIKWRAKCGDVHGLYIGSAYFVFVHGYDNVKDLFVKNSQQTGYRRELVYRANDERNYGVVLSNGMEWKERRSVLVSFLKNLDKGKNLLENHSKETQSSLMQTLRESNALPIDFRLVIMRNIMSLMFSFIVGRTYDVKSPTINELFDVFCKNRTSPAKAALNESFPWLKYFPFDFFGLKDLARMENQLKSFSDAVIDNVKSKMTEENLECFIEHYLNTQRKKNNANETTHLSVLDLRFALEEMYFAGADTIANSIWIWSIFMVHYPEVQEKVFQEIKDVIGLDTPPTLQDRLRLKYTNAMVLDTLRRTSLGPFSLPHFAAETFTFKGFTIPKGAILYGFMKTIHHDESIFGDDVMNLNPEHFLDQDGNVARNDKSIPFSIGMRACPGEALSMQLLCYYVTCIVQRFKIEAEDPNNLPSVEVFFDGLMDTPPDCKVRFVERFPQTN